MSGSRNSVVKNIKSRLNMVDIVRRYVDLRKAGNRWVAPCPFHNETKPSFSVNEEEGFFYCFGCQAAGDLFDFYGRINGLEFRETLEQLAEEAGVKLTESFPDSKVTKERNFRKTALAMYDLAQKYFCNNLSLVQGKVCREYLENRKTSKKIIDHFNLGWSLSEWQGLANALRRGGFSFQQGIEAGLLAKGNKDSAYDRFRGRLIFPIKNLSGQPIAFGGRIIDDEDAAKYINSTDSLLYKKGDNLYGLYQARRAITAQKSAMLTEGYMDVLTLHQFGYENACGVLGTALTDEQVRKISGFCSTVELIFDGDAPGRKAALRSAEMLLKKGMRCKVILLPEKEDIDSLLHEKGKNEFEYLRNTALNGLDFCIKTLIESFAPREIVSWVKNFVASVEQPELLTRYISRLTQALELDELEIRDLAVKKKSAKSIEGDRNKHAISFQPIVSRKDAIDREIMRFVVRYPHHLPILQDAGARLILTERWATSFWNKLRSCAPDYDPAEVIRLLDDKEKEFWGHARVIEAPPPEHEQEELAEVCAFITGKCREKQDVACMQALRQSASKGDDNNDLELLKALNETLVQKRSLGSSNGEY